MKLVHIGAITVLIVLASATLPAFGRKTPEEARAEIMQMQDEALRELVRAQPASRDLMAKSVGTAVFSTKGMKIGVAGSDKGKGVLVEKSTGKKTFMKMRQVNVGLGYGIANSRFIFVFQDRKAMEAFAANGWDFSGKADATASAKGQGGSLAGAAHFMPGVLVYQFTKNGLTAEITLTGTKFWADSKLNSDSKDPVGDEDEAPEK